MNKKHLACLAVVAIAATPMFANVAMADGKVVPAFTHITPEKVEAAPAPLHIADVTDGGKTHAVLCHGSVAAIRCVSRDGAGKVTPAPATAEKKGNRKWKIVIQLPTPIGPVIVTIDSEPKGGGTSTGSGSSSSAPKAPPSPKG